MANTSISSATMLGVLQQLPHMSERIVDDTRHEKVLSYMCLFLQTPGAVDQLLAWDIVELLRPCLDPQGDYRVMAVAIRFLGDGIAAKGGGALWEAANRGNQPLVDEVVQNVDSRHALVRLSCLRLVRQAVELGGRYSAGLLMDLDYPRLVMRRLLDPSCFVVTEACGLLGCLYGASGAPDMALQSLVERLVARPYDEQNTARKTAVLASIETLLGPEMGCEFAGDTLELSRLEPYLFDVDRLVQDRALDVLERMLAAVADLAWVREMVAMLERRIGGSTCNTADLVVSLRCLAAAAKQLPDSSHMDRQMAGAQCRNIVDSALSLLRCTYGIDAREEQADFGGIADTKRMEQQIWKQLDEGGRVQAKRIACEAVRVVREFSQRTYDSFCVTAMSQLAADARVQAHAQLMQLVLDVIVQAMRRCPRDGRGALDHIAVHGLVANFAVRAPGLRTLLDLSLEIHRELEGAALDEYAVQLAQAVCARLVDVEWEARDTALEFIARAASDRPWPSVEPLAAAALDDAVHMLADKEEYVRASSAQALRSMVEHAAPGEFATRISSHPGLQHEGLRSLLDDSEAFVKRAALDLIAAIGRRGFNGEWVQCLDYAKLYQMADDPDFEVRVRLVRLLELLVRYQHLGPLLPPDEHLDSLQGGAILLDMCRDSSRYVRSACLESLQLLKRQFESDISLVAEADADQANVKRRMTVRDGRLFYDKLCQVDFGRLEALLTAEHLYQEALDTQVERELMRETHDPNAGNNVLDCY
ncbi:hypothetical protein GGF46_004803 [Coemansia sp. RSA 552]|nr:hypothetical protein GGF46_004803 [Coemansia sp. RSA 552]